MLQGKTRRILTIAGFTAVLTAGSSGFAVASAGSPEPVETGYMMVEDGAPVTSGSTDCPSEAFAPLDDGSRL